VQSKLSRSTLLATTSKFPRVSWSAER
jgi:hypothetical protein